MGMAAAVIGGTVVSGIMSSSAQQSAAETAAGAQTKASEAGIAEQRRQFDAVQKLLSPYVESGAGAIGQQMALIGAAPSVTNWGDYARSNQDLKSSYDEYVKSLSSPDTTSGKWWQNLGGQKAKVTSPATPMSIEQFAQEYYAKNGGDISGFTTTGEQSQQMAIQSLLNSPQFQMLQQQGENALLQNASATGGLRGGNLQAALAQFRPQLLSQLIESQFSKLGQLSGLGQASAAGQAAAAQQTGSDIASLLGQQGAAQAGAALASGAGQAQAWGNVGQAIGNVATLKALKVF